jgi:DNA gyrase subunit A
MGRGARGVTAIKMGKGDCVVGADVIAENERYILTVTVHGIGKKSDLGLYRLQNRGGKGLINIKITEKLGKVVGLVTLNEEESEIILCSEKGILNKQDTSALRAKGRATQGVKLVNLKPGDRLVAIEKVKKEED